MLQTKLSSTFKTLNLSFVIHVIVLLFDQSLVHNVAIYSSISQKKKKENSTSKCLSTDCVILYSGLQYECFLSFYENK